MIASLLLPFPVLALVAGVAPAQCELEKLTSSARNTYNFGVAVGLSDDYSVVGAPYESVSGVEAGGAYVFQASKRGWVEVARLFGTDVGADHFEWFGFSVAIAGNTILIGAPRDSYSGGQQGAVYVFEFDGSAWTQTARLTPFIPDS